MRLLLIFCVFILFVSCQKPVKPPLKVAVLKTSAALPLVVLTDHKTTNLDWQLSFVSTEELAQLIEKRAVDLVQTNPIDLISLREAKVPSWGILSFPSPYGLFVNPKNKEEEFSSLDVAVDEKGLSGLLLDLWFGSKLPLHLSTYGDALRLKLLEENKVKVALLGGEEFYKAKVNGYRLFLPRDIDYNVGLLAYIGAKDDDLFTKILDDYSNALTLYNKNPHKYNDLYTSLTGQKVETETLNTDLFYNVNFFNTLLTLRKMKDPLKPFVEYTELFWIPKQENNMS